MRKGLLTLFRSLPSLPANQEKRKRPWIRRTNNFIKDALLFFFFLRVHYFILLGRSKRIKARKQKGRGRKENGKKKDMKQPF